MFLNLPGDVVWNIWLEHELKNSLHLSVFTWNTSLPEFVINRLHTEIKHTPVKNLLKIC